jgi:uncharacterized membrane protein
MVRSDSSWGESSLNGSWYGWVFVFMILAACIFLLNLLG